MKGVDVMRRNERVLVPIEIMDKLNDIAYEDRQSANRLAVEAIRDKIKQLEQKRGCPYPARQGCLPFPPSSR